MKRKFNIDILNFFYSFLQIYEKIDLLIQCEICEKTLYLYFYYTESRVYTTPLTYTGIPPNWNRIGSSSSCQLGIFVQIKIERVNHSLVSIFILQNDYFLLYFLRITILNINLFKVTVIYIIIQIYTFKNIYDLKNMSNSINKDY